jgi:hypothetical protein
MTSALHRFYDEGDLVQNMHTGMIAVVIGMASDTHVSVVYGEGWFGYWYIDNVRLCQVAPETTGDP